MIPRKPPNFLQYLKTDSGGVLERAATVIDLPAGKDLFCEGDLARSLYVVRSGSLGVYISDNSGGNRLVGLVGPGETVGEMAMITREPRSATVTAIRDSQLLMLSQARFNALLKSEPELMTGVMRLLIHRLKKTTHDNAIVMEPRTIAVLPVSQGVDAVSVSRRLAKRMSALGKSVDVLDGPSQTYSVEWFAAREQAHDFTILTAPDLTSEEWLSVCVRQADRIVLLGAVEDLGKACPTATRFPAGLLEERARHQLLDLIVFHRTATRAPTTQFWTNSFGANRHFHLRDLVDADWLRLARVLCGQATGLVLSGGGARAFAHIGVLKALEEAQIPIDFVGATSMGGLIGAGVAIEWSIAEMEEQIRESFVSSNPVSDYTWPIVGLTRGGKVDRLLSHYFGDLQIENLWRPFYCVSSNLTRGGDHIHRSGRLSDALRASISLPGILPPVPHHDGLLVDGAVTNNLPVDIMRRTHRGRIIAVDVARDLAVTPADLDKEQHGNWFRRLLRPPIVSILMRAGTISSHETDRRQAENADLLFTPPLDQVEIRDWKAFDETVEIGYRHAIRTLENEGTEPTAGRDG